MFLLGVLAKNLIGRGVEIRISWCEKYLEINKRGVPSIPDSITYMSIYLIITCSKATQPSGSSDWLIILEHFGAQIIQ